MNQLNKHFLTTKEFVFYSEWSLRTVRNKIKEGLLNPSKENKKLLFHFTQLPNECSQEVFLKDRGLLSAKDTETKKDDLADLKPWQRKELNKSEAIVMEYLSLANDVPKNKKTAFKESFAKQHGKCVSSLDRRLKLYCEYGREALIPGWNNGNKEKIIDRETAKVIQDIYLKPNGPSIRETHEKFCAILQDKRISYRTLAQYINATWTKAAQLLVRNRQEWDRLYSPHVRRDWDKVKLNEVWFGDAKQIDVACIFRGKPIFPWITWFMDAGSRKIVGWILTPTHDSWAIAQSFVYGVSKHGVPGCIYIDRGKPYKSRLIAGEKHKKDIEAEFEATPITGLIRDMGSVIFFAAPYNAREKIIEPAGKVFTQRLNHLPGNRGHNTKARRKKCDQEIKSGKLLSFDELSQEVDRILNERNSRPHSTTGLSPNSCYENYTPVIPSEKLLAFFLMDVKKTKVRDSCVYVDQMLYRDDNLWRIAGEQVEVRRDPKDLSKAAVIYQGKLFCIATLETPDHYRGAGTLENRKTCARIRKQISRHRKAIIEGQEILDNPEQLEQEGPVRGHDIRPADSKVRGIHAKEKLAKDIVEQLQNHAIESSIPKQAVVSGNEDLWEAYRKNAQLKEDALAQETELRLVPRTILDAE